MSELRIGRIEQLTHTPAPWRVVKKPVTVCILDKDGNYITENIRALPNQDSNARLIAAAPDLLTACMAFVHWYNVDSTEQARDDAFYAAQAAIAKAEGAE